MPMLAIVNYYGNLPDPGLETRSYQILSGVTGNPDYFPAPQTNSYRDG